MTEPSHSGANAAGLDARALQKWLVLGAAVFLTCIALFSHPTYSDPQAYFGYALRVTAWLSLSFFLVAYVARPMLELFDSGWRRDFARYAVRERRYFGLGAAFVHTVHFGYVVMFLQSTDTDVVTLIGGGLAFVLLWLMALTSNRRAVLALGERWRWLHRAGMHYLWFIFVLTLSSRVGLSFMSSLMFALAMLAALLRAAAYWQRRNNAS